MTLFTKLLIKRFREQKKYFAEPEKYAQLIKNEAGKFLPQVKVFLFGSVLEGAATPSSDIDILVVSPKAPKASGEQARIKAQIYQRIGLSSPFEIHLVTPEGFSWYQRFLKKKVEI